MTLIRYLPRTQVEITEFQVKVLNSADYKRYREFHESFHNLFDREFRVITFKLPNPDLMHIDKFRLQNSGYCSFSEFNQYNKSTSELTITVRCLRDKWEYVDVVEFEYIVLDPEIVLLDIEIDELISKRNKKAIEKYT